jgi:X-X-X-Leu-X-X-Gly heptad repeat protein
MFAKNSAVDSFALTVLLLSSICLLPASAHAANGFTLAQPGVSAVDATGGSSNTNQLTCVLASNPSPGDLVVVMPGLANSLPQSNISVRDANGNNYTVDPHKAQIGVQEQAFGAYLLSAPANASKTITVTYAANIEYAAVWCADFTVTGGTAQLDSGAAQYTSGPNPLLTIPVHSSNELVISMTTAAGNTGSAGSPWTEFGGQNLGWDAEYALNVSADTAISWTGNGGTDFASAGLSFRLPHGLAKPPNNLGLVGYWSFDEGTGTKAGDFSGKGNMGTFFNAPTWTNGKRGKALAFVAGNNDYISMGTPSSLGLTNTGTLAAWFKTGNHTGYPVIVGNANYVTDRNGYLLSINDVFDGAGTVRLEVDSGSASVSINSANAYDDNQWHYAVGTWDGSNLKIYIDGEAANTPVAQGGVNAVSGVNPVIIGRDPGNDATSNFDGNIDEVRIYSRALSAAEVKALYGRGSNAGGGGAAQIVASTASLNNGNLARGLVGYWTFDGPDITTSVKDMSGNGNNGGFVGGATSSAKVSGKLGQALRFDGVDDYLNMGNNSSLEVTFPFTIAAWVKASAINTTYTILTTDSSGVFADLRGGGLQFTAGKVTIGYGCAGSSCYNNKDGTTVLKPNVWYHVVGVVRGFGDMDIYINGVDDGGSYTSNGAGPVAYSSGPATMGDLSLDNVVTFPGSLDDVRIYNRALSATEVNQLYRLGQVIMR